MSPTDDEFGEAPERPSKSERKRQMLALQAMGEQLVAMTDAELSTVDMPDELAEAVALARRINSREGKRRQLQYIGKLMRKIDTEVIREALERRDQHHREQTRRFHEIEQWRDRLIRDAQPAIDDFKAEFPNAERQKLRALVSKAQQEKADNRPPASSRKLFRYLREVMGLD